MKKLLTITALLFSVTIFGQNWKNWKSIDDIKVKDLPKSKLMIFNYTDSGIVVDNFTWLVIMKPNFIARKTYQIDIKGVLTQLMISLFRLTPTPLSFGRGYLKQQTL